MENRNSSNIKFIMSSKAQLALNRATAKVTRSDHHTFLNVITTKLPKLVLIIFI